MEKSQNYNYYYYYYVTITWGKGNMEQNIGRKVCEREIETEGATLTRFRCGTHRHLVSHFLSLQTLYFTLSIITVIKA